MKELLITSGFPRSGSTYLNQALNLLYYPKKEANWNRHTVVAIEEADKILVTFRNPVDSLASWHNYPSGGSLEADLKYYIRFYYYVLNNLHKVVLMDFEHFTKNVEYIKQKVFTNFGLDTNNSVSDSEIKDAMVVNGKIINLPRNNKEELNLIKKEIINFQGFAECVELYVKLKSHSLLDLL